MEYTTKLSDRFVLDRSENEPCYAGIFDIIASDDPVCEGNLIGFVWRTGCHTEEDCGNCGHRAPFPGEINIDGPEELKILNGMVVNNLAELVLAFEQFQVESICQYSVQ